MKYKMKHVNKNLALNNVEKYLTDLTEDSIRFMGREKNVYTICLSLHVIRDDGRHYYLAAAGDNIITPDSDLENLWQEKKTNLCSRIEAQKVFAIKSFTIIKKLL